MKKLIGLIVSILILTFTGQAWAPLPYLQSLTLTLMQSGQILPLGSLCQDKDDGKLYKGTGAAVVELAAAAGIMWQLPSSMPRRSLWLR